MSNRLLEIEIWTMVEDSGPRNEKQQDSVNLLKKKERQKEKTKGTPDRSPELCTSSSVNREIKVSEEKCVDSKAPNGYLEVMWVFF